MPAISDRNLTVYLGQDDRTNRMVPNRRPAGILPILKSLSPRPRRWAAGSVFNIPTGRLRLGGRRQSNRHKDVSGNTRLSKA